MNAAYRKVKKYLDLVKQHRYCNKMPIDNITICPCGYKENNIPPSLSDFKPYRQGDDWGNGFDSHVWFHFTLEIPEHMKTKPVELRIESDKTGGVGSNPQFLLYINGKIRQGLDVRHKGVPLLDPDDIYDIYIYSYTGARIPKAKLYAELYNVNIICRELYYDLRVPFEALSLLDEHSLEYAQTLRYLEHAVSLLHLYELDSDEFYTSMKQAKAYMDTVFYDQYCGISSSHVTAIGHTHIDCAWLWTLKQTREKVQRSFATVLELMKQYPEYKFMSSQALLYQNCKEETPELYEEIKKRVAEGRWEVEGSMWVEADCNLSSGESLVRQVVYGKRFFKEEFGVNTRVLWLPDVFGYSAALPQILKKCGVDWFVTSKISWNDTNTMPYDTFEWYGIDGTPIHTYFLTAQNKEKGEPERHTTYNAVLTPAMVAGTSHRYQQKNISSDSLITFGYGDGGGGPTREHLEIQRRMANGIPGLPETSIEFAGDFLSRLEKKMASAKKIPTWHGELYLEFHRGTYTSIAKNKRNNRKSEYMYMNAETIGSMAKSLIGLPYPKDELHDGWEMLLTNQFHDIIPGSSIREVYEQSDIDYAVLMQIAEKATDTATAAISKGISAGRGYVIFNPNPFAGNGIVEIEGKSAYVKNIPAKGYAAAGDVKRYNRIVINDRHVETAKLRVHFDENWLITSVYDKENDREIIKAGEKANEIRVYPDHPDIYDAWEWQEYSLDEYTAITDIASLEIVDDGARRGIKIVRPFMKSTFTQTIWFYDDIAKIDFESVADWQNHHHMIKAAFPVDIHANKATYDIQYGTLERPTHKNTSWDTAQFEVCAHKYADLSEGAYGVSLMSDCKYGYDIHDHVMQISLLKTPTWPNEVADIGESRFTYSLCPHKGTLAESNIPSLAYELNNPMFAVKATGINSILPEEFSMVDTASDHLLCEVIKEAEDSEATVIRLYESKNIKSTAEISLGFHADRCYLCDLMENELEEIPIVKGKINLPVHGFEIITLKVK